MSMPKEAWHAGSQVSVVPVPTGEMPKSRQPTSSAKDCVHASPSGSPVQLGLAATFASFKSGGLATEPLETSEGSGGTPLPMLDARAGEAQALVRDASYSLAVMQETLRRRGKLLPLLGGCAVALGLWAAHAVEGADGIQRDSMLVFTMVTELLVSVVAVVLLVCAQLPRIGKPFSLLMRSVLVWGLCTLITLSSPGRRGRLLGLPEASGAERLEEPCEEGASTQWIALLLGFPAVFHLLPFAVFAPLSQFICLQHLLLGLFFRRPECTLEGQPPSGPLLGMQPIVVSSLQLHLLALQFAVVSWRSRADELFVRMSCNLVDQTKDIMRRGNDKSTHAKHEFTVKTGLEVLLEEMLNEELACMRLLSDLSRDAPVLETSCGWVATVHALVRFLTHVSARVRLHSTALRAAGTRTAMSLPMRDSVRSAPGEVLRMGIHGFIEQSFMAEPVHDDGSDEGYLGAASIECTIGNSQSLTFANVQEVCSTKSLEGQVPKNVILQEMWALCERGDGKGLGEWTFNALETNDELGGSGLLRMVGFQMLSHFPCLKAEVLASFLQLLEDAYIKENPYHTQVHAADVTNAIFYLANSIGLWTSGHMNDVKRMSLLLAALGHDVGHFGRNSHFLIATKHALATTYNDKSILENFHTAMLFRLIDRDRGGQGANLLSELSNENYSKARQLIVTFILATDTQSHLEALAEFRLRTASMESAAAAASDDAAPTESISGDSKVAFNPLEVSTDQAEALSLLIRAADIGHSAKRWDLHEAWSWRVADEFHAQGDEEKRLGSPVSPLCDRVGFVMSKSQMGFLNIICLPTWNAIARFEHALQVMLRSEAQAREGTTAEVAEPAPAAVRQSQRRLATGKSRRDSTRWSLRGSLSVVDDSVASTAAPLSRTIAKFCQGQCESNLQQWKSQAEALKGQAEPETAVAA